MWLPLPDHGGDISGKHPAILHRFPKDPVTIATSFLYFPLIFPPGIPRGHLPNKFTTCTHVLDLGSASGALDYHVYDWCQLGSDLGRGEDIFSPTKQNLGSDWILL